MEKLVRFFDEIKNQIGLHVVIFDEPERGVEFEFMFGGEYTAEEFERVFSDLKKRPDLIILLEKIIKDANNRTQKERAVFVDTLMVPRKGILITEGAKERREARLNFEQFLININSMSISNLENMLAAIDNLKEVD